MLQKWNILFTNVLTRNWVCFVTVLKSVVIYFFIFVTMSFYGCMYLILPLTKVTRLFAMGEFKHTYLNSSEKKLIACDEA